MIISKEILMSLLKNQVVTVEFTKADGTKRVMNCTLMPVMLPPVVGGYKSVNDDDDLVRVVDIDLNEWRSFKISSLISVGEYKKPKHITKRFSADFLHDVYISKKYIDNIELSRDKYSIAYRMIFPYNGKYYYLDYSLGTNKFQNQIPFSGPSNDADAKEIDFKVTNYQYQEKFA